MGAGAQARALEERDLLQKAVQDEGGNFKLAAWDWRYYAEKVRKARFDVDEAEIKPYLQLDNVIDAAFDVADKLFGVTFKERKDLPGLSSGCARLRGAGQGRPAHRPVLRRLFRAGLQALGRVDVGLARAAQARPRRAPDHRQRLNFAKGAPGEPSLLSVDDARTLFHEFGHGLHGLLSNVTYPALSGTSVERDFVELPSQLYEHWLERPEVLRKFGMHYKTGKPMPEALLKRIKAARTFNQGFATVEYLASAIVDIDLHVLERRRRVDVDEFEAETLARIGMPAEIVHAPPHPAFPAYLRRLCGRLLQLHVVGGDGCGRLPRLRGGRRCVRPQDGAAADEFIYSAGGSRTRPRPTRRSAAGCRHARRCWTSAG